MSRAASVVLGVDLLMVGLVGLLAWLWGDSNQERAGQQFDEVTSIEFDLANAPVEFTVGGEGEVKVEYTYSTGLLRTADVTVEQDGQVLRVEQDCPRFFAFNCRATFDILVPDDIEISGSTSNGAVVVSGVTGPVEVATSNGPVTLEGLSSDPLTVRTSNGPIRGDDIESGNVEATTSNGQIELSFATGPRSVMARSSNGAIELYLPSDAPSYAVDTSTSNGNVQTGVRTDPASSQSISARTSNGDITIAYR